MANHSFDNDQTVADSDQTLADSDQTIRRRTALQRGQTAVTRLASARERDETAHARDLAALARDRAAAARDLAMARRDAEYEQDDARTATGTELIMRAARQRRRARDYRVRAAEHRAQAARDREAAAIDREQGARDRLQALTDCEALARAPAITEMDALTGPRTRAAGLADLDRELDRSRRTSSTLVVGYVDAVGLKRLNDSEGHDAGDRLLKRIVALIIDQLRPYDLIVRLAGDEFLCAMSNMTLSDARRRFSALGTALAASLEAGAIRTGFAELTGDETAAELIMRADSQLIDVGRER
jgi:diguanylate cyclase (GGDEF)-like protein